MRVRSSFRCPGCEHPNPVQFRKPDRLTPSMFATACAGCGSRFFVKVTVPKLKAGARPGQVSMSSRCDWVSPELAAMRAEEARYAAMTPEEQEAAMADDPTGMMTGTRV